MGQTDKWALPYPEADTLISVSAPIVQELAEKIDAALSAVTASDEYIIPGTLIGDFTTSGTFTPPAGVTLVHVCVIGGGGAGRAEEGTSTGGGGGGGGVAVFRNVPVSGLVAVTVGGNGTASAFGAATAPPGGNAGAVRPYNPGVSPAGGTTGNGGVGAVAVAGSYVGQPGWAGIVVNGTTYAGGGGGMDVNTYTQPGGAGGGGASGGGGNARPGANGLGGGGGGGGSIPGTGGSGRVMVFTEQTTRDTIPAPIDPVIMAALNDGVMVGAYAIDPVAPVDTLGALVPMPDAPQPTGEEWTDEDTGETHPVLAWPTAGWTYIDGEWSPPND